MDVASIWAIRQLENLFWVKTMFLTKRYPVCFCKFRLGLVLVPLRNFPLGSQKFKSRIAAPHFSLGSLTVVISNDIHVGIAAPPLQVQALLTPQVATDY